MPYPSTEHPVRSPFAKRVAVYFGSGWAFFIPYLAAYLLYAGMKWPVNPPSGGEAEPEAIRIVPALLQVYWVIHSVHLILGALWIGLWLQKGSPYDGPRLLPAHRIWRAAPWICVGLIFWLPGIYLEWPSDPWEHLRRINEWHVPQQVMEHGAWSKFTYFLPYSLTGHVAGTAQLDLLRGYYVAVSLLLCAQYYRLGRSAGLSDHLSFVLVLVSVLTLGNSVFSFHRYYGLSSSIVAQLGAIAMVRMMIETAGAPVVGTTPKARIRPAITTQLARIAGASTMLALVAFSHQQGLSIVAFGIAAIVAWWIVERYRLAGFGAIGVVALGASFLFLQLYPHSAIIQSYQAQGWLNSWYGFNFLEASSPAWPRMMQVLGAAGLANGLLSLFLLRGNHVAGWLTFMPFFALQLPFVSIPLVEAIARHGGEANILVFHRFFLAVPPGLAAVVALQTFATRRVPDSRFLSHDLKASPAGSRTYGRPLPLSASSICFLLLVACLVAGLTAPISHPHYGRFWHALARTPADSEMQPAWEGFAAHQESLQRKDPTTPVLSSSPVGFVLALQRIDKLMENNRIYSVHNWTPTGDAIIGLRFLSDPNIAESSLAMFIEPSAFVTSQSIAGFASTHWSGQEAPLATAGVRELKAAAQAAGFRPRPSHLLGETIPLWER
jgi:hypothetical protein